MPDTEDRADKAIRRAGDHLEDNIKLVEEALFDAAPAKYFSEGNTSMIAPIHSHQLIEKAKDVLNHGNIEKAAYQLRREVDFCNAVPKMHGSPYEKTGQAGLKAVDKHQSAAEINNELQKAWEEAWTKNPAPFYDHGPD